MNILHEYLHGDIYLKHNITEAPKDADFRMHLHDTCEVYLFIGGDVEYLVEGYVYPLKPGSLIILRPFESHKTKTISDAPYERYVMNFPLSMFDSIDPERRLTRAFWDRENGSNNLYTKEELAGIDLEKLFNDICYAEDDDYGRQLKVYTALLRILDALNSVYLGHANELPKSREAEIVSYVNAHLCDNITVEKLAEHFYLSPSQFTRIFKVATGTSPWSYIILKRLNAARERIRLGASVQNAFEASGFNDYSAFYRAYIKYFGNPPTDDSV